MSISLSSRQTDRQTQWEWVDLLVVQLDLPTVREWFNAINNKQLIFVYNFIRTNQSQLDFPLWIFMNECCVCVCAELSVWILFNTSINQIVTWRGTVLRVKGEYYSIMPAFSGFFSFADIRKCLPYNSLSIVGVPRAIMRHLLHAFHPIQTDWRQKCLEEPHRTGRSVNGNWNVSPILWGIIQVGHT